MFLDYSRGKEGSVRTAQERVAAMRKISFEEQLQGFPGLPEVVGPEPLQLQYLQAIWLSLNIAKTVQGSALSFTDLLHYSQVNKVEFEPWEVDVIMACDKAFCTQFREESNKGTPNGSD